MNGCTGAYLGLYQNMPVMAAHHRINHGQTQPAALFFGGKVRIKDPGQEFGRNTGPEVLNENVEIISGVQRGHPPPAHAKIFSLNYYAPFRWRSLYRVNHQILNGPAKLPVIGIYRPELARQIKGKLHT